MNTREIIERIETKAEKWRGQSYKLYNDAEPMHPYSVLRMLANELREELGLPVREVLQQNDRGDWVFVQLPPTAWERLTEEA